MCVTILGSKVIQRSSSETLMVGSLFSGDPMMKEFTILWVTQVILR